MAIFPIVRTAIPAADAALINYSNFDGGPPPPGPNTSYFTECGPVTYGDFDGVIYKKPSMSNPKVVKIKLPTGGVFCNTLTDQIKELEFALLIGKSVRTPQYRLDRIEKMLTELRPHAVKYPNVPYRVMVIDDGVTRLYTPSRALAKAFDPAPALSAEESNKVIALSTGDEARQAAEAGLKRLFGFVVAERQASPAIKDLLRLAGPGIAMNPWWAVHACGGHVSEIDTVGVLELHFRIVAKLKSLQVISNTRDLGEVITDVVLAIDPSISPFISNLALSWYTGRYPYNATGTDLFLLEGVHPGQVSAIYSDLSFNGTHIVRNGTPIAEVIGAQDWSLSTDQLSQLTRASFVLEDVLTAVHSLLADKDGVISPARLDSAGCGFIRPILDFVA